MRNEGIVELYAPRRTLIGRDGITKIPHFLQRLSSKCVLVVTDKGLIKVGTAGKVTAVLDNANIQYVVYDGVEPNPTTRIVYDALHFYQEHQCDAIIAIGGGSPIDVAKAVSILSANGGKIQDYNGYNKSKKRGTPIIAVNTTAGTGSECTRAYVVTDEETKTKMLMVDTNCLAHLALNDPMLMVGMPPSLTAATGIDALTHAIEAYVSTMANDYTDGLALKAMKSVLTYLPSAYENGAKDPIARQKMADAACLAGMAFANAFLGLNHSMAHKLGAYHHLPHGVANALILTDVMRYNASETPTKMGTFPQYAYPHTLSRYVECAHYCGIVGKNDQDTFEKFLAAIEDLKEKVGIKKTIKDYGIDEQTFLDTLDEMVENAFDDQCTGANPRYPLMSEIKELYLKAYYGK